MNVAAGLHLKGYRTLLVDLDPQGNATTASGVTPDESDPTIYEILKGSATAADAILTTPNGYDLIPTDIREAGVEIEIAAAPGRDYLLKEALNTIADRYDYAMLDAPPSLSVVTLTGLTAADGEIITLKADYLALKGVAQLMNTTDIVRRRLNPDLTITGVLITFYSPRRNLDRQILEQAGAAFPGKVFDTKIATAVALGEAPGAGMSIYAYEKEYRKGREAVAQYDDLTDEIITRTQPKKPAANPRRK